MFGIDDVLTGGLSLLGGVANNMFAGKRQDDAQQFNAQQAAANRDFQERMSNTAYQRSAADMQAAGLNRILAVGGGASSPSGNMATSSPGAPVHDMLGPAVNTAMAHGRLKQELNNMKATEDNTMKDTRLKVSQGNTEDARTVKTLSEVKNIDENTKHTAQEIAKGLAEEVKAGIDASQYRNKAMEVLRQSGNIGQEVQRASSAVGNIPALINSRWPKKTEETVETVHNDGRESFRTRRTRR